MPTGSKCPVSTRFLTPNQAQTSTVLTGVLDILTCGHKAHVLINQTMLMFLVIHASPLFKIHLAVINELICVVFVETSLCCTTWSLYWRKNTPRWQLLVKSYKMCLMLLKSSKCERAHTHTHCSIGQSNPCRIKLSCHVIFIHGST